MRNCCVDQSDKRLLSLRLVVQNLVRDIYELNQHASMLVPLFFYLGDLKHYKFGNWLRRTTYSSLLLINLEYLVVKYGPIDLDDLSQRHNHT